MNSNYSKPLIPYQLNLAPY